MAECADDSPAPGGLLRRRRECLGPRGGRRHGGADLPPGTDRSGGGPAPGVRDGFRATASDNRQAQLLAVFQDVALAPRPEEMLQILVRDVARSLDAAHCAVVFSVDEHRGRLIAVAERPEVRNLEIGLADYPEALHAASTGRTAFIPDVRHHPLFAGRTGPAAGHPGQPTSAVAVPIVFQGKGLGFLILRTALPRPNLTADEVAFVETLVVTTVRLLEHEDRRATLYRRQASAGVTDSLTGCGGLDALDRRIREEMHRADRYGRRFSVMLLDVDGLRFVNQRLGVEAGDRVLGELGGGFQRELRSPDFVARYGGDEFVLIMPETGEEGCWDTLVRLRRAIAAHSFGEGDSAPVGVTAGWVGYPGSGLLSPEDVLARAEADLVARKHPSPEVAA
ncbi:MAG: sensor domain-containing diguanylate cyclase [Gemmatimonadetes bacterium]|nr:sensor domain-containing diguanylate cyclase [Gemmatimonadota bacterium]